MANVRVGVRRIEHGMEPREVTEPTGQGAEINAAWIEINGQRFGGDWGILKVSHEATGQDIGKVTIELASSSYATVDHREPEAEQEPAVSEEWPSDLPVQICPNQNPHLRHAWASRPGDAKGNALCPGRLQSFIADPEHRPRETT